MTKPLRIEFPKQFITQHPDGMQNKKYSLMKDTLIVFLMSYV